RSTELLEVLHRGEVQRRFRLSDTDVETLAAWIKESGIRWGLDLDHRAQFDLTTAQNTIRAGLDRLLLGVALPEADPLAGVLPHGDIVSTEIDLLGTFAEFLSRLHRGIGTLQEARTLADWSTGLARLLPAIAVAEEWQESELARGLARIAESGDVRATAADVLHLIDELAHPRPSSANLRTGALTVASLAPMRSVPHKVVCLVGMDDGAFPRAATLDGDDVLARRPLLGERHPRYEDRQLFLDAIMSATDQLLITFSR